MDQQLIGVLGLSFAGVLLTGAIAIIKSKFKVSGTGTKVVVALLSLLIAGLFKVLVHFNLWGSFLSVVMISQTVYSLILKK